MARIKTYIAVEGDQFDQEAFQNKLGPDHQGFIATHWQRGKGRDAPPVEYWRSEDVEIDFGYPEDMLHDFLSPYSSALEQLAGSNGIEIGVSIVVNFDSAEEVGGYFLSDKVIKLLAKINASLDIDMYVDSLIPFPEV